MTGKKKAKTGKKKTQVKKKASTKKTGKKTGKKAKASADTKKASSKPTPIKVYKIKAAEIEVIYDQMVLDGFYPEMKNIKYSPAFCPMIEAHFADGKSINDFAKLVKVSSMTIERWTGLHVGFMEAKRRGEATFIMRLPDRLIKFMEQGFSFRSFALECGKSSSWLYALAKIYPRFEAARQLGGDYSFARWERLGMALVSGTLQAIASEEPMLDKRTGEPIIDKATGKPMMKITYRAAHGCGRTFKHMTAAKFDEYKGDNHGDQGQKDELADALAILEAEETASRGK